MCQVVLKLKLTHVDTLQIVFFTVNILVLNCVCTCVYGFNMFHMLNLSSIIFDSMKCLSVYLLYISVYSVHFHTFIFHLVSFAHYVHINTLLIYKTRWLLANSLHTYFYVYIHTYFNAYKIFTTYQFLDFAFCMELVCLYVNLFVTLFSILILTM